MVSIECTLELRKWEWREGKIGVQALDKNLSERERERKSHKKENYNGASNRS